MLFTPTRAAGLARLAGFQPRMGRAYAERRNVDRGPGDRANVSMLSPWLRHRLVSEEEALNAALVHGENAAKFISEVLWRSYFKGWLEQRPAIWARYCTDRDAALALLDRNGGAARDYAAAIEGRTGIDCFDAWADELITTGWLHNHARMWFASIWIFTLRLPWQLGADFFLRHLLDGDAASNTLSWRWVAGLHRPGKHYLARADNIRRYTAGRFDPRGLNEAAECLPMDGAAERAPLPSVRPLPDGDVGLVLYPENVDFMSLALPRPPTFVLGLTSFHGRTQQLSPEVIAFGEGAVRDAVARAAAHFGCEGSVDEIATLHALSSTPLVTPWLGVGWQRDWLASSATVELPSAYDSALWPLATAGFFKLKAGAGKALAPLGYDLPPL